MNKLSKKSLLLWFYRSVFQPQANQWMRYYSKSAGSRFDLKLVGGYPKSGTTWVSKMMAHYLGLPLVMASSLGIGFPCVVHHHWDYHPAYDPSVYVIRDGRDVMVSIYMNLTIKNFQAASVTLQKLKRNEPIRTLSENIGHYATQNKRLRRLYGDKFDPLKIRDNLPRFIEDELRKPFITAVQQTWSEHILSWKSKSRQVVFIKYEDLLQDVCEHFSMVIEEITGRIPEPEEINATVKRFSFQNQSGREPGNESQSSFMRKGIHGDWKNHFSKEACQIFDFFAGDLLIELGYEDDHRWMEKHVEI